MRPKLLGALNALLVNNPFEEMDNVFFSLTEAQRERGFPVEMEIYVLTSPRELVEEGKESFRCYGEVMADKELVYQVGADSMHAMLEEIKAFLEAIDDID